jgi:hypothetical protein
MTAAYDARTPYERFLVNEIERLKRDVAAKIEQAVEQEFGRSIKALSPRERIGFADRLKRRRP